MALTLIREDDRMNDTQEIPVNSQYTTADQLEFLVAGIEEQRKIIDRDLTSPARWRGLARRELEGKEASDVRKRLAIAYDGLMEKAKSNATLDVDLLLQMHKNVVDGGEFRSRGVRVGKKDPVRRPHSSKVSSLVEKSLERAEDGVEPIPLAAARLHLELLIIHPFSDSNGRVARLAASYMLMLGGYHSTLLTCVEQHFQVQPRAYARAFRILKSGKEKDHAQWLITALQAMTFNSMKAAWFYNRKDELFNAAEIVELDEKKQIKVMTDYDLGKNNKGTKSIAKALKGSSSPLTTITNKMHPQERDAIVVQVERLNQEQMDEGMAEDRYTSAMVDMLKKQK
jgi:Fic family protein